MDYKQTNNDKKLREDTKNFARLQYNRYTVTPSDRYDRAQNKHSLESACTPSTHCDCQALSPRTASIYSFQQTFLTIDRWVLLTSAVRPKLAANILFYRCLEIKTQRCCTGGR
jgi:hypothetical protein